MRGLLCILIVACVPPEPVALHPGGAYAQAVAELDHRISAEEALADGADWTRHERAAWGHLARARLTGQWSAYDDAEAHLEAAFRAAPRGSGPHEAAAAVALSLHHLPQTEDAVQAAWASRPIVDDLTAARWWLVDAQRAWQSGDYDVAQDAARRGVELQPSYDAVAFQALQRWKLGDPSGADGDYARAADLLREDDALSRSWIHLQRGLLDLERDRVHDALEHYLLADAAFPGWWLVHEHVAEALVLLGRSHEALEIYENVVHSTGAPEFRDAIAELLGPDHPRALDEVVTARAAYDDLLERFPEAVAGHALDHMLAFGSTSEALRLAEANLAARPNAESWMRLAQARLLADDRRGARAAIDAALDTPWRTPELHEVAAEVFTAVGEPAKAQAQRAAAEALRG